MNLNDIKTDNNLFLHVIKEMLEEGITPKPLQVVINKESKAKWPTFYRYLNNNWRLDVYDDGNIYIGIVRGEGQPIRDVAFSRLNECGTRTYSVVFI